MIRSVWGFGNAVPDVARIRQAVFGENAADELDKKAMQLVLYDNDEAVACGRLVFDKTYQLGFLAVLPQRRGQAIGDMLLRLLLFRGFHMMADSIRLTATDDTAAFFEKYGFHPIGGLLMEVTPDTLKLEGKCGHDCASCAMPCTQK